MTSSPVRMSRADERDEQADGAVRDDGGVLAAHELGDSALELARFCELGEPPAGVEVIADGLLLLVANPRRHLVYVIVPRGLRGARTSCTVPVDGPAEALLERVARRESK